MSMTVRVNKGSLAGRLAEEPLHAFPAAPYVVVERRFPIPTSTSL